MRWICPLIILAILLAAIAFRWEEEVVFSYPKATKKIVCLRDRWTGEYWVKTYHLSPGGMAVRERPANIPYVEPIKPIPVLSPSEEKLRRFDFTKPAKRKLGPGENYEVAMAQYNKDLAQYETDLAQYETDLSDYLSQQEFMRNTLTTLWVCLMLGTLVWLQRAITTERRMKNVSTKELG